MKKYYALETEGSGASIMIYGDITSWPWMESDVSAYLLSKRIDGITADRIDVYINSYGGEVAEGLAIYHALKRHAAKVVTHCDGFACSAASIIFMAGDERVMGEASLLMIHNAWSYASGNAEQLRKAAEDLETISEAAANAYRACVGIDEAELTALLANETWILPQDAVDMGFATGIEKYEQSGLPAANARGAALARMQGRRAAPVVMQMDPVQLAREVIAGVREMLREESPEAPKTFLEALMRKEETK